MVEEIEERKIRQYLLGEMPEAEMSTFEERLMTNDDLFEMLLVIEDDLIDARADEELSAEERRRFDTYFLVTSERRERLELARALHDYAARHPPPKLANYTTPGGASEATTPAAQSDDPGDPVVKKFAPQEIRPSPWSSSHTYLSLAAAAIILIAAGLLAWLIIRDKSDVTKGLQALNHAYRDQRPTEARITGFEYAPLSITRGADSNKVDTLERDYAELMLRSAVREHPNAKTYHAVGLVYLARRDFDNAIESFDKALPLDANNAKLHSDLGAAYLEKGKAERDKDESGKSLQDYARSLQYLSRALELDGTLLEARFNRAILYQYLTLPQQAKEDWQNYLERDATSRWADEARQELERLNKQQEMGTQSATQLVQSFLIAYQSKHDEEAWKIISQNHSRTGNIVVEQLLDAYLNSLAKAEKDEARKQLELLLYAGRLASERGGDRYFSDLARFYKARTRVQQALLTKARHLMKLGHEQYGQGHDKSAIARFSASQQLFMQAGDVCESQFAQYWLAFCNHNENNLRQSQSLFEQVKQTCEREQYLWLRVRALYGLTGVYFKLREHSKAIELGKQSLKLAEQINDTVGMLNMLTALIEFHRYIGNYEQALDYMGRSLPLLNAGLFPQHTIWRHYTYIAFTFNSLSQYAAAVSFQKEALRLALQQEETSQMCISYTHLGLIYGKSGDQDEALKNVQLAAAIAQSHSSESVGQQMMAYSALQLGHLYRESGDFDKALADYNQSIEIYNRLDYPSHLYQAHKGRLLCYVAQENDAQAESELQTALGFVEKYRTSVLEENNRNGFFDIEQNVYDLATDFAYSRKHDPQRAFDYSEKARARSLLDMMRAGGQVSASRDEPDLVFQTVASSLTLREIQQRMPPQVQILQYAILEDKLIIWVISKTGEPSSKVEKIAQKSLNEKVFNFVKTISSPSASQREGDLNAAKELFDILIRPVDALLDGSREICIVPDKALNYLPFAALISQADRFLLQDYLLVFSPSASVFVVCSEIADQKGGQKEERLLSVGNPTFDHRAFPRLADLPSAGREAQAVAACYNTACLLIGKSGRVARVKSEMEKSDVLHLALHAIADERNPMRSNFLLAKEPAGGVDLQAPEGVLRAYDIYQQKLPRTRLAVLSACQTSVDRYYKGEGMISLARPFIASGVPLVAASLWPVDSNSTADLMIRFHQERKREPASTVAALRRAQLAMLDSNEERLHQPYYWAAFIAIGGYTNY